MALFCWTVLLGFVSNFCFAQGNRRQLIERYLVPSYITFLGGLNYGRGHGALDDLLMEADINQHLHWQPRFFKDKIFLKIIPRVRLRMIREKSSPIRTPSFMPNATAFFGFGKAQASNQNAGFTYYSVMFSHHSNGQAGDFYNQDGAINLLTGSFSTNFLDFGINRVWGLKRLWQARTRLSLVWHLWFNRNDELDNQFERVKVAVTTSTIRATPGFLGRSVELQGYISYTLSGLDYTFIPGPNAGVSSITATWKDRINWGISISFGKRGGGDFLWFIKIDHSYDYYNINFWQKLRRIQFGIAADPL